MRCSLMLAIALLGTSTIVVADESKSTAPADPAAKRERRVAPEAMKLLRDYDAMRGSPASCGLTSIECVGTGTSAMIGGEVKVTPAWTAAKGVTLAVEFPDSTAQRVPAPLRARLEEGIRGQLANVFDAVFGRWERSSETFDVGFEGGAASRTVVLDALDAAAATQRMRLVFAASGLLEKVLVTPKLPPGAKSQEFELALTHVKLGTHQVLESQTLTVPFGKLESKLTYYELAGGVTVPREVRLTAPFSPEPLVVSLHDYKLDGKLAATTAAPASAHPVDDAK